MDASETLTDEVTLQGEITLSMRYFDSETRCLTNTSCSRNSCAILTKSERFNSRSSSAVNKLDTSVCPTNNYCHVETYSNCLANFVDRLIVIITFILYIFSVVSNA